MRYIIFGNPGVGKTSVVNGVLKKTGVTHIHWGDLSFEVAKEKELITDKDELRHLDLHTQQEVRKEVTKKILATSEQNENILIETHAAVKTPQGYWPGLSRQTLENLEIDVFIVLSAKPEHIFERRLKDTTRERKDELTIEAVEDALNITNQMAITYAVLSGGTFIEIENKEGDLDYSVNMISKLISN